MDESPVIIKLQRYSYGEYETEGQLIIGSRVFATIEQPWTPNPNGFKGGKPFESCIPDGMYRLVRFTRPTKEGSAAKAWMIFNPDLGVYRFPEDHDYFSGRDLCLIHQANWASQIQGCIAPGLERRPMIDPKTGKMAQAVGASGTAMQDMRDLLGEGQHILSITNESAFGASDER